MEKTFKIISPLNKFIVLELREPSENEIAPNNKIINEN